MLSSLLPFQQKLPTSASPFVEFKELLLSHQVSCRIREVDAGWFADVSGRFGIGHGSLKRDLAGPLLVWGMWEPVTKYCAELPCPVAWVLDALIVSCGVFNFGPIRYSSQVSDRGPLILVSSFGHRCCAGTWLGKHMRCEL